MLLHDILVRHVFALYAHTTTFRNDVYNQKLLQYQ